MDREALPANSISAGEEFDLALKSFGFRPEGLLWAWDKTIEHFVLVLVTEHFDFAGPKAIYQVLTDAYRASVTPKEISPFIVRIHSPRQAIIQNMVVVDLHDQTSRRMESFQAAAEVGDLTYVNHWVYRWPHVDPTNHNLLLKRKEPTARSREWSRISKAVSKLAA